MSDQYTERLAYAYFFIKQYVINKGFSYEIDYADELKFSNLQENVFLKEAAWVILSSGMSFNIIANKFDQISSAFYNWESIEHIVKNKEKCKIHSLEVFNNKAKINAIIQIACIVEKESFEKIKSELILNGIDYLMRFPFIGPATKFHLAKNIGFDVAKPDRHLVRICNALGYNSANDLCNDISERISEKTSIVDLVIWRYATLDRNYLMKVNHFLRANN
jgi:hypothetical protein